MKQFNPHRLKNFKFKNQFQIFLEANAKFVHTRKCFSINSKSRIQHHKFTFLLVSFGLKFLVTQIEEIFDNGNTPDK